MPSRRVKSRVRSSFSTIDASASQRTHVPERSEPQWPVEAARELREHGSYLFFKHGRRFCNPLVREEWDRLQGDEVLHDEAVRAVVEQHLIGRLPELTVGIYSPVPIARAFERGVDLEAALGDFRYEMIHVDADGQWWWQGRVVAERLRTFFHAHLGWEPDLGLHYFEYRVSDQWFDKCYLLCDSPPIQAIRIDVPDTLPDIGPWRFVAYLDTGDDDSVDPETLRLDDAERLLVMSDAHGEVLVSGTTRFQLLSSVREDLCSLELGGRVFRLHGADTAAEARAGTESSPEV